MEDFEQEDGKNHNSFALWAIFSALMAILVALYIINGTLKEIYSDTHYSTASTDYLLDIKNALER
ncbi:MAG: hypothetical protein AAB675_01630 [Patescibacteria group bacterium]